MTKRLVFAATAMAAAAFMTLQASAQELVLGLSYGKTGRYSSIGKTTEAAVDIAVREINAKGGVNGRKIRLVKFDTAGDPKQAVVAVRKLANDDKALAVIGPFSSSEARVAFPAGERIGIVQIPNASSAPKLADKFSYAYRMTESEFLQMLRVAQTLKKRKMFTNKGVAIMFAPDDVVSKAVGMFIMRPVFKKFGVKEAIKPIAFRTEAFDLSPQVSQLKGLDLDYVGVAGITPIAIRVLKEMRKQGIKTPLIGSQIWADPEIVKQMGSAADGSVFIASFWYRRDKRAMEFSQKFVQEVKKMGLDKPWPHHVDAAAYDIVYVLAEAMRLGKVTGDPSKLKAERLAIRDTLKNIEVEGVMGKLCFESNGDAQLPGYVLTMEKGKWELLEEHKPLPCKK